MQIFEDKNLLIVLLDKIDIIYRQKNVSVSKCGPYPNINFCEDPSPATSKV